MSDHDREEAASALREHAAAGRLGVDELSSRVEAVFSARTRSEIDEQFADLPGARPRRDPRRDGRRQGMRVHTNVYLAVSLGLVVLWAATGAGYFWPVWPILGWGIGVFSHMGAVRSASG